MVIPRILGGPILRPTTAPIVFLQEYVHLNVERIESQLETLMVLAEEGTLDQPAINLLREQQTWFQQLDALVDREDLPGLIRFFSEQVEVLEIVSQIKREELSDQGISRDFLHPDLELFRLFVRTFEACRAITK
jgi:hypothetical protein